MTQRERLIEALTAGGTPDPCPGCGRVARIDAVVEPVGDFNEVRLTGFACSACDHEFPLP